MKKQQELTEFISDYFSDIYCDNCQYEDNECDECKRKSMGWALSDESASDLATTILKMLKDDNI